jgi:hypothetical protein
MKMKAIMTLKTKITDDSFMMKPLNKHDNGPVLAFNKKRGTV